jgi:predicted N-formylglutamate amidohydrolase
VILGVSEEVCRSQAGWDHGAYGIVAQLGEALGLPVHTGAFTRLFVDLNRHEDHPDVIPEVCYGAQVPGNRGLGAAERRERLDMYHRPYWQQVRRDVYARLTDRRGCLHLSSHSFDPALDPGRRDFDVGVLYDPAHAFEAGLAERLLFGLAGAGLRVRANQPYSGVGPAICTSLRQELAGKNYAGIELETSHAMTHRRGGILQVAQALLPLIEHLRDDVTA